MLSTGVITWISLKYHFKNWLNQESRILSRVSMFGDISNSYQARHQKAETMTRQLMREYINQLPTDSQLCMEDDHLWPNRRLYSLPPITKMFSNLKKHIDTIRSYFQNWIVSSVIYFVEA